MTGALSCVVAAGDLVGARSEQQDAHGVGAIPLDDGSVATLVVLADGMGGEIGGRLASRLAVDAFLDAARDGPASDVALRLRESLLAANLALADRVASDPALSGMGCTLIGLAFARGRATWVSVGDSLILRLTDEGTIRLNADHSMAPAIDEAVARGEMSVAEGRDHPQRSILLSALTGRPLALIDEQNVELGGEDRFVVASDGLLTLDRQMIARIAAETRDQPPESLVASLLAAVEEAARPEQDNCMIVAVRASSRAAAPARVNTGWGAILLLVAGVAALTAAATILLLELPSPEPGPASIPLPETGTPAGGRREGIAAPPAEKPPRKAPSAAGKAADKKAKQGETAPVDPKAGSSAKNAPPPPPPPPPPQPGTKAGQVSGTKPGDRQRSTPPPRNEPSPPATDRPAATER